MLEPPRSRPICCSAAGEVFCLGRSEKEKSGRHEEGKGTIISVPISMDILYDHQVFPGNSTAVFPDIFMRLFGASAKKVMSIFYSSWVCM